MSKDEVAPTAPAACHSSYDRREAERQLGAHNLPRVKAKIGEMNKSMVERPRSTEAKRK